MKNTDFQYLKKKINFKLFNYQELVEIVLKVLSALFLIAATSAIIYEHGFYTTPFSERIVTRIVTSAFLFYIFKFLIHWLYSPRKKLFLKENIMEFVIIIVFILSYFVSLYLYATYEGNRLPILIHHITSYFHVYYFCIVFVEIAKVSSIFKKVSLSPPLLMMLSFLSLIIIGSTLLRLPKMTTHFIPFIDTTFTAISASCITGLTSINIAENFTQTGQIVIMVLVQLGGMSILSFATFFITFLSHSYAGLRYQYLMKEMLETKKISETSFILRQIFFTTFVIEGAGAILLYLYWQTTGLFSSDGQALFYSIFHAISAFNNAGFSLWSDNMMAPEIYFSYFPLTIIMILVFVGGIGFMVLRDFFDPAIIKDRKKKRWRKLTIGTQIVLITTFSIIIIGTIIFCALEYNHALADKDSFFDKLFTSCFQVVVTRSAGFNITHVGSLLTPTTLLIILIMFIGSSPGSTGGGIKTTTFFVIIKSIFATIRGKNKIEFNRKTIPFQIVDKSFSIVVMSLVFIFLSSFLLSIFEPKTSFLDILFESVSSFTTSGLSTGCSSVFSDVGKVILAVNMYIGRIGTLTLAYALSKRIKETRHEYPETYFMVG